MGKRWKFHFLQHDEAYFLRILRLGASRMLWTRTSVNRKEFRGIQNGIDKGASLALCNSRFLSEYDKGILRSITAGAVYTQQALFKAKQTDHNMPTLLETTRRSNLLHLFWLRPAWDQVRSATLSAEQLRFAHSLLPCTRSLSLGVTCASELDDVATCIRTEIHCEQLIGRMRINAWKVRLQSSRSGNKTEVFKWLRLCNAVFSVAGSNLRRFPGSSAGLATKAD